MDIDIAEIQRKWSQMTAEEFAQLKREDLGEDVRPYYDLEVRRRQSEEGRPLDGQDHERIETNTAPAAQQSTTTQSSPSSPVAVVLGLLLAALAFSAFFFGL